MNDWLRSIFAPIVVAVLVGMATSYLSTQAALAQVVGQVQRHETEIAELRKSNEAVARMDERIKAVQKQLERIEDALKARK
jgi:cell division protein FtsL